uniref:Uncharacterized protein n=1 Tax=Vitrella brassicaformis TaxID=1169539 RepID=A0A7S1JT89_9ALVE|mmetsp:Transcript_22358/g.55091  ORF Transcript_22358/g.55091 Transcript_22358/m.55091 type:complete len:125 (+) Transcript_22358:718-1092(+)
MLSVHESPSTTSSKGCPLHTAPSEAAPINAAAMGPSGLRDIRCGLRRGHGHQRIPRASAGCTDKDASPRFRVIYNENDTGYTCLLPSVERLQPLDVSKVTAAMKALDTGFTLTPVVRRAAASME